MKLVAALLICATLTACGDHEPSTAVVVDEVVAPVVIPAPVPSPAPVLTPTPAPCRPSDTGCKVLFCQPVGNCALTEEPPSHRPPEPVVIEPICSTELIDGRCERSRS